MSARVLVAPALFNAPTAGNVFPVAPAAGVDAIGAGGTAFATAWPGVISGVMIPNPLGNVIFLYYVCGATAGGAGQVFCGDVVAGQVLPATTFPFTITANSSGWLGPWSAGTYNQQAPLTIAPAAPINATALVAAAQGCIVVDFTTTTTLSVRAYQSFPITP